MTSHKLERLVFELSSLSDYNPVNKYILKDKLLKYMMDADVDDGQVKSRRIKGEAPRAQIFRQLLFDDLEGKRIADLKNFDPGDPDSALCYWYKIETMDLIDQNLRAKEISKVSRHCLEPLLYQIGQEKSNTIRAMILESNIFENEEELPTNTLRSINTGSSGKKHMANVKQYGDEQWYKYFKSLRDLITQSGHGRMLNGYLIAVKSLLSVMARLRAPSDDVQTSFILPEDLSLIEPLKALEKMYFPPFDRIFHIVHKTLTQEKFACLGFPKENSGTENEDSILTLDKSEDVHATKLTEAPALILLSGPNVYINQSRYEFGTHEDFTLNNDTEHTNIICDGCKTDRPLRGVRFQCINCEGFDLCASCVKIKTVHDTSHPFFVFKQRRGPQATLAADTAQHDAVLGYPNLLRCDYFEVEIRETFENLKVGFASCDWDLQTEKGLFMIDFTSSEILEDGKRLAFVYEERSLLQQGDILGVNYSRETCSIEFSLNGNVLGGPVPVKQDIFPVVSFGNKRFNSRVGARAIINIGQLQFSHPPKGALYSTTLPACLHIPRDSTCAGCEIEVDEHYENLFTKMDDLTVSAWVCWMPSDKTSAMKNKFVIVSYDTHTFAKSLLSWGIFAGGRLYCVSPGNFAYTDNFVMIPGRWQFLSISCYKSVYQKNMNFNFVVDGSPASSTILPYSREILTSPLRDKKSKWIIGAENINQVRENQLSGFVADLRVWKRNIGSREITSSRGREYATRPTDMLLFRLRFDEVFPGTRNVYCCNESLLQNHNRATLYGNAKMEISIITRNAVKLRNASESSNAAQSKAMGISINTDLSEALTQDIVLFISETLSRVAQSYLSYTRVNTYASVPVPMACVNPTLFTFLLLRSIMKQALRLYLEDVTMEDFSTRLLFSCAMILRANVHHILSNGVDPNAVGLGRAGNGFNTLGLRRLLLKIVNAFGSSATHLNKSSTLITEILKCLADGMTIFYESSVLLLELTKSEGFDRGLVPMGDRQRLEFLSVLGKCSHKTWCRILGVGMYDLKWSLDDVRHTLSDTKDATSSTKPCAQTELVKYLCEVVPVEWLQEKNIIAYEKLSTKTANELLKLYEELVNDVTAKRLRLKLVPERMKWLDDFVKNLMAIVTDQPTYEIYVVLNRVLQTYVRDGVSMLVPQSNENSETIVGSISSHVLDMYEEYFAVKSNSNDPEPVATCTVPLTDWGPSPPHLCRPGASVLIFDKSRSSSLLNFSAPNEVSHDSNKTWACAISQQGYARETGIHDWQIQVTHCNSHGHLFLGLATSSTVPENYLGFDRNSFGILLAGTTYYDGQARKRSIFPTGTFETGSTIRVSLDTGRNQLSLVALSDGIEFGNRYNISLPDLFSIADDGVVYPAICLHEYGDCVEIHGQYDVDPYILDHWLSGQSLLEQEPTVALVFKNIIEGVLRHPKMFQTPFSEPLSKILVSGVSFMLLWRKYDYDWAVQIRAHIVDLLCMFTKDQKSIMLFELLLAVLLGKLSGSMVVSKPPEFAKTENLQYRKILKGGFVVPGPGVVSNDSFTGDSIQDFVADKNNHFKIWTSWMDKHVLSVPAGGTVRGFKQFQNDVHLVIAVFLYHTKLLQIVNGASHLLNDIASSVSKSDLVNKLQSIHPDGVLLELWRKSFELVRWLSTTYPEDGIVHDYIFRISRFLLELEPCHDSSDDGQEDCIETNSMIHAIHQAFGCVSWCRVDGGSCRFARTKRRSKTRFSRQQITSASPTSHHKQTIRQLLDFYRGVINGELTIESIREQMISQAACTKRRSAGFRTLSASLTRIPLSQHYLPLFCGVLSVFPSMIRPKIIDRTIWHYLDDLDFCAQKDLLALQESFSLYAEGLTKLARATELLEGDCVKGVQIAVFNAWGLRIKAMDNECLSRTGILDSLHQIFQTSRNELSAMDEENELLRLVGQTAMKCFYILCYQVVTMKESNQRPKVFSGQVFRSTSDQSASSLGSQQQTLASIVFKILFQELKLLVEVRDCAEDATSPKLSATGSKRFDAATNKHLEDVTDLLLAVGNSAGGQSLLLSESWLSLLVSLATKSSGQVQAKGFRVLRIILPNIDPKLVRVRIDGDLEDIADFLLEIISATFSSTSKHSMSLACEATKLLRQLMVEQESWMSAVMVHLMDDISSSRKERSVGALALLSGKLYRLYPGSFVRIMHPSGSTRAVMAEGYSDLSSGRVGVYKLEENNDNMDALDDIATLVHISQIAPTLHFVDAIPIVDMKYAPIVDMIVEKVAKFGEDTLWMDTRDMSIQTITEVTLHELHDSKSLKLGTLCPGEILQIEEFFGLEWMKVKNNTFAGWLHIYNETGDRSVEMSEKLCLEEILDRQGVVFGLQVIVQLLNASCFKQTCLDSIHRHAMFSRVLDLCLSGLDTSFELPFLDLMFERHILITERLQRNPRPTLRLSLRGRSEFASGYASDSVDLKMGSIEAIDTTSIDAITNMGFPKSWAIRALREKSGNVSEAISWICANISVLDDADMNSDGTKTPPNTENEDVHEKLGPSLLNCDMMEIDMKCHLQIVSFSHNKSSSKSTDGDLKYASPDMLRELADKNKVIWGSKLVRARYIQHLNQLREASTMLEFLAVSSAVAFVTSRKLLLHLVGTRGVSLLDSEKAADGVISVLARECFQNYPFFAHAALDEISGGAPLNMYFEKKLLQVEGVEAGAHTFAVSALNRFVRDTLVRFPVASLVQSKVTSNNNDLQHALWSASWASRIVLQCDISQSLVDLCSHWVKMLRLPVTKLKEDALEFLDLCLSKLKHHSEQFSLMLPLSRIHLYLEWLLHQPFFDSNTGESTVGLSKVLLRVVSKLTRPSRNLNTELHCGPGSRVELLHFDNQTPIVLKSTWSVRVEISCEDKLSPGQAVLLRGLTSSTLQILLRTSQGQIGIQTNRNTYFFDKTISDSDPHTLLFVCHRRSKSGEAKSLQNPLRRFAVIENPPSSESSLVSQSMVEYLKEDSDETDYETEDATVFHIVSSDLVFKPPTRVASMAEISLYVDNECFGSLLVEENEAEFQCGAIGSERENESFAGVMKRLTVWDTPVDIFTLQESGKVFDGVVPMMDFDMSVLDVGHDVIVSTVGRGCAGYILQDAQIVALRNATQSNATARPRIVSSSDWTNNPRYVMFLEDFHGCGVMQWSLDKSLQYAIPMEFQHGSQTFRLRISSLGVVETSKIALVGDLRMTNLDNYGSCEMQGSLDLESGAMELHTTRILATPSYRRQFLETLRFEGTESGGNVVGKWFCECRVESLQRNDDDSSDNAVDMYVEPCFLMRSVRLIDAINVRLCQSPEDHHGRLPISLDRSRLYPQGSRIVLILNSCTMPLNLTDDNEQEDETSESTNPEGAADGGVATWSCVACTFINEPDSMVCAICNTANPTPRKNIDPDASPLSQSIFTAKGVIVSGSGSYMWEFEVLRPISPNDINIGVCAQGCCLSAMLGLDKLGWGISFGSRSLHDGTEKKTDFDIETKPGDIIGVLLDTDTQTLSILVNHVLLGVVFDEHDSILENGLVPCIDIATEILKADMPLKILGFAKGHRALKGHDFKMEGMFVHGKPEGPFIEFDKMGADVKCMWSDGKKRDDKLSSDTANAENAKCPSLVSMNVVTHHHALFSGMMTVSSHTGFVFDASASGEGVVISNDGLSAEYISSVPQRVMVLGSTGYESGIHYWEVKVQGMQWGSMYIGVVTGHGAKIRNFGGWGDGYGFINYRATHGPDGEKLYGSFYNVGDVVGVLLDLNVGLLRFFKDGKVPQASGEKQVLVDLGVAYSSIHRPRRGHRPIFYPCVGMSKMNDKVSIENVRHISQGTLPSQLVMDLSESMSILENWNDRKEHQRGVLAVEAFESFQRWFVENRRLHRTFGDIPVEIFQDKNKCRAMVGEGCVLLPGQRVETNRGVATVVGWHRGNVWYTLDSSDTVMFWTDAELNALRDSALLPPVVTNGPQADETVTPLDASMFLECINSHWWSLKTDGMLVEIVNAACDRLSCEAPNLNLSTVADVVSEFAQTRVGFGEIAARHDLVVRFTILACLNLRIQRLLPYIDFSTGFTTSMEFASGRNCFYANHLIRKIKMLTFTRVKTAYWNRILSLTETQTKPAADEYDLSPEIPIVKINRIQAGNYHLSSLPPESRLKRSVFGQLMNQLSSWNNLKYRRAYTHIQDMMQQRCFYVKFEGEGVADHGGPYRAVFQIALEEEAAGPLELLVPCPNATENAMQNADVLLMNTDWNNPGSKQSKMFAFFGKLLGMAIRHNINIGLSLPGLIWAPLVGESLRAKQFEEIDSYTYHSLQNLENFSEDEWDASADIWTELLLGKLADPHMFDHLLENSGTEPILPYMHRMEVIRKVVEDNVMQSKHVFAAMVEGMSCVLPLCIFRIFDEAELEDLVCGSPEIDLDLLKQATVYEGVDPDAPHIRIFWQALESMNKQERSKFINFVFARSRLPTSLDKFPMNFKILPSLVNDDYQLPKSQTCFFSLNLPEYSSVEVCREKLIYASNNCNTMEDFDNHDGAIFESISLNQE